MTTAPNYEGREANDLLRTRRRRDVERGRLNTELKTEGGKQQVLDEVLLRISRLAWSVAPGAQIRGRIKSLQSISSKLRLADLGIDNLLDFIGVRVIVQTKEQCYRLLQRIHRHYEIIVGECDDYIESPKPNGYRSLHTTILASHEHPVEVQIRTQRMHVCSESGAAAHSIYKQRKQITDEQQTAPCTEVGLERERGIQLPLADLGDFKTLLINIVSEFGKNRPFISVCIIATLAVGVFYLVN
jgi:hypothetical protein